MIKAGVGEKDDKFSLEHLILRCLWDTQVVTSRREVMCAPLGQRGAIRDGAGDLGIWMAIKATLGMNEVIKG